MNTIGLRVTPNEIYYAITSQEEETFDILKCSKLVIPVALNIPEQLAFIRTSLISIISEYKITHAGLRIAESNSQFDKKAIFRLNVEGVIQEVFANSTIEKYACCNIAILSGLLEEDRTSIKKYMEKSKVKREVFAEINDWLSYKKEECETIVVATACSLL